MNVNRSPIQRFGTKEFIITIVMLVIFIAGGLLVLSFLRNANRRPSMALSTVCTAPCWEGIQPGQTTFRQVEEYAYETQGIFQASISPTLNREDRVTRMEWLYTRPVEDTSATIYFDEDEQVTAITIATVNSLRLGDLLDRLGEPQNYWNETGQGENREYLETHLIYPNQGCLIEVVTDLEGKTDQVEISRTTPVFRVTYFDPAQFEPLLADTRALIRKPISSRRGSLQPWPGLGAIPFTRDL